MTKECIENFNTNFSKGKFEIFAGGMGYDEKKKNTNCYCCDVGNLYIYYEPNSKENSFLILTVKIKNISNSMIKIDSGGFQLFLNEKQYSPTMVSLKDAMNFEDINPGTEITKKIFYDVPDDVANSTGLVLKTVNNIFSETGEAEVSLK